ncbi:hypothetical protein FE257_008493 [Aspergillus nanangensis]|uniref:Amine oxidase domain-containing protein n=1 Tax=Aspergillus nanangensis TaxID=2582783 RepID=A0AAD4CLA1_ASPNN|nr:hypothetical protein FE257_008493 [Aspergillus nanangensis]
MDPTVWKRAVTILLALSLCSICLARTAQGNNDLIQLRVATNITAGSLHNIHLEVLDPKLHGNTGVFYGPCDIANPSQSHHKIAEIQVSSTFPERIVWITPSDAVSGHCLHAFSGSSPAGKSAPVSVATPIQRRQSLPDVADMFGPWFEGVSYMEGKDPPIQVVERAKKSSVAIIGGGISGLFTSLLLDSVGMHNWHIVESSQRLGGRIFTQYMNGSSPEQYQYSEMGAMRFPISITYLEQNETIEIQDQKMVLQLAEVLNRMNCDHPELQICFIDFIQRSPNVPAATGGNRLPNGRIPTAAQVAAVPELVYVPAPPNATAAKEAQAAIDAYTRAYDIHEMKDVARNLFKAHKAAAENGLLSWSEAGYLRHALGYDANTTDYVASFAVDTGPLWDEIYDSVYFAATTKYTTIDKGIDSLTRAFGPHITNRTTLGRKRDDPMQVTPESRDYDFAIVTAPFSQVRLWDLPRYSPALSRAINTLNYDSSCKMAMVFKSRFWEHQENPIFGGCGRMDNPGIGRVCYPSYNINGTGPGVLIGSYISQAPARSTAAICTEEYVALVLRALVEFHGPIARDEYTGIHQRLCFDCNENFAGAFAAPMAGQQEVYLPAYYQTEFKTIFIGEHTGYTHAWVFSALDSAVRGTVQLLLDLGLIDEARTIVTEWMGRWIHL